MENENGTDAQESTSGVTAEDLSSLKTDVAAQISEMGNQVAESQRAMVEAVEALKVNTQDESVIPDYLQGDDIDPRIQELSKEVTRLNELMNTTLPSMGNAMDIMSLQLKVGKEEFDALTPAMTKIAESNNTWTVRQVYNEASRQQQQKELQELKGSKKESAPSTKPSQNPAGTQEDFKDMDAALEDAFNKTMK